MRRLFVAFMALSALRAQQPPSGAIRPRVIRVVDAGTGAGLEQAEIVDLVTGKTVHTSRAGRVAVDFLNPGEDAPIRARKPGFQPLDTTITPRAGDTSMVTLRLTRMTALAGVHVVDTIPVHRSPAMSGFEERQRFGIGRFYAPAQLRAMEERGLTQLADALRALGYLQRRDPKHPGCSPQVILNGQRVRDLPSYQTGDYEAVEYYASAITTPAQWGGSAAGCGTLVFWSRER